MAVSVARPPVALEPAQIRTPTLDTVGFRASVYCRDGRAGNVTRLVLEPDRHLLTHIVVTTGAPLGKQVVIPSDSIVQANADRVDVNMCKDELQHLAQFQEFQEIVRDGSYHPSRRERAKPMWLFGDSPVQMSTGDWVPAGWMVRHRHRGLPVDAVPLGRGTAVHQGLKRVGRLDQLLLEDDRRSVTDLVVKQSGWRARQMLVPVEAVESFDEDGVWLDLDRDGAVAEPAADRIGG